MSPDCVSRLNPVRSGNVSENEKNGVTLTHCKLSLNISLSSPPIGQMTRNVTLENSSHTAMHATHHGELHALTLASISKTWHDYCPTFPVNEECYASVLNQVFPKLDLGYFWGFL